jgi:aminoglycoside phosphotransferase family enzyme/predicted kinase
MHRLRALADAAPSEAVKNQAALVEALRNPDLYEGVNQVTVLETHISYVLLTGRYAYKIKKAVNLSFLDYRTLDARHFFCEEELRLNRRLALDVYLDVLALTGSTRSPAFGNGGPAIEYAVKMREFEQDALLSRMLEHGTLTPSHIDALAQRIAEFHDAIDVASAERPFGDPAEARRLALDNFAELRDLVADTSDRTELDGLREWTEREYAARAGELETRRHDGFVRECHGDLHLNNIALVDGRITVFDCIEFNEHMRWGDVMNEIAFVTMDLEDRKHPDLAFRFLNAYLEKTGDYAGLGVVRFFVVYRAMVRAKVAWFRAAQPGPNDQKDVALAEYRGYVNLARRYAQPPRAAIVLMHGFAGSGKTTESQRLLESVGAIRIRTDVERKRLHARSSQAHVHATIEGGIYSPTETDLTYRHVCALTRRVTTAGYVTIVDAAFLKRQQRDQFRDLASELGIPFLIVSLSASAETLRDRLNRRSRSGAEVSEADTTVLEYQERTQEPLAPDEQPDIVAFEAKANVDPAPSTELYRTVRARLA